MLWVVKIIKVLFIIVFVKGIFVSKGVVNIEEIFGIILNL